MTRSKVIKYGMEEEVIALLGRGKGPNIIAARLNAEHDFEVPLNHVNIINFRKGLPGKFLKGMEQKEFDDNYLDPMQEAVAELAEFREAVMPEFLRAIKEQETKELQVWAKVYMDLFDRHAKLEGIITPRAEMKVKYLQINNQFNDLMDRFVRVFRRLCPADQQLVMNEMGDQSGGFITVDALEVKEEP